MLIDLTTDEVIKTEAIDKISSILDYWYPLQIDW